MPPAPGGERPSPAVAEAARLFNERIYYESHDLLEEEWAGARGSRREALKALVKIAAGMYHLQTSGFAGAESLLSSAVSALGALPSEARLVEFPPLAESLARVLEKLRVLRGGGEADWDAEDLPRFILLRRESRGSSPRTRSATDS